ncbi:cytochrome c biogenesis protein CcsA [Sporomusa aerivorans]|uniref:cytochrome c biogenesis protein CcsA n=1 Tax=Sporomusa aerivorans TaxID=204936 RepID=UPI00352AC835
MIGYSAVALALISSISAIVYAGAAAAGRPAVRKSREKSSRLCFHVSAGCVAIAVLYLLYLIFGNRFDYGYVFSYSASDLPAVYKFSAFWAGQEGSFLLWLVFQTIFGWLLNRKPEVPAAVLAVFSLLQAILLLLLLIKSPFLLLAEPRLEGAGLNPLLQDPWMVLHPPVLFLGYAALAVPFAYAVGGLLTGRHRDWLSPALPWILFAVASLGAGIFIGGFWAYKVLGWGGYWAWDPVENSSLVPWLAAAAAVHLIVLAKRRTGAVKAAYAGVLSCYILVLYGTFLTRSGVLSDFSTHSFADEGVGGLLGIIVLLTAVAAFALLIAKLPGMPPGELYQAVASREFILALTALLLAFFGALVFVGMSTPLVTLALGSPQSVGGNFYNLAGLPLALALAAALTAGALLKMPAGDGRVRYWLLGLFLLAGLLLADRLAITRLPVAATVCLACMAAMAGGYAAFYRTMTAAAVLSHTGVAVMLIGIMASGAAGQTVTASFTQGETVFFGGEPVSYAGVGIQAGGTGFYHTFHAGEERREVTALTKLNKQGDPASHEPGIYRTWLADIYIAPVHQEESGQYPELTLVKGQQLVYEGVGLIFKKFTMAGMDGAGEARVQALIEVVSGGAAQEVQPELVSRNGRIIGTTVPALERYELHITGIKPGEGKISIELRDTASVPGAGKLTADVSIKPLINLVWLGAALITAGTGWAAINRVNEAAALLQRGQGVVAKTVIAKQK